MDKQDRRKLTPPQVARLWGVHSYKVLGWIKTGQLRVIDVTSRPGKRHRHRIDVADLAEFERKRTVQRDPPRKRRRTKKQNDVIEYF